MMRNFNYDDCLWQYRTVNKSVDGSYIGFTVSNATDMWRDKRVFIVC